MQLNKFTVQDWNSNLKKLPDPKAKVKDAIKNLSSTELRAKISKRLEHLGAGDLATKFKARRRERLIKLYIWLIDLYDDREHSWVFFEPIRQSKLKRFIVQ